MASRTLRSVHNNPPLPRHAPPTSCTRGTLTASPTLTSAAECGLSLHSCAGRREASCWWHTRQCLDACLAF